MKRARSSCRSQSSKVGQKQRPLLRGVRRTWHRSELLRENPRGVYAHGQVDGLLDFQVHMASAPGAFVAQQGPEVSPQRCPTPHPTK